MALDYKTSETLIESIKSRISIPVNQNTFSVTDILSFADEETTLGLVPTIMSMHEDYFLYSTDVDLVANQAGYSIPSRAVGNKLSDVQYIDSSGNVYETTRINIGDIPYYQESSGVTNRFQTYYIKNNKVILHPGPGSSVSGSLRFIYYLKPSKLVQSDEIAVISAIDTDTGVITVSSIPDDFSLTKQYDFYMVNSPHRPLNIDLTVSNLNSTSKTMTFTTTDIPSDLAVGDHIAIAGETNIPQIPSDLHVLLAQQTAERILESQGDTQGLQNAKVKTSEMKVAAGNIIDNRVENSPQKAVNFHGGLGRGRIGRFRRG